MAVCGNRVTALRSLVPRLAATHRAYHGGRGATGTSWSRVAATRTNIKTVGVCGSDLKPSGVRVNSPALSFSSSTMAPISPDSLDPGQLVDRYIAENKVMVFSKSFCPFCHRVSIREGKGRDGVACYGKAVLPNYRIHLVNTCFTSFIIHLIIAEKSMIKCVNGHSKLNCFRKGWHGKAVFKLSYSPRIYRVFTFCYLYVTCKERVNDQIFQR